MTTPLTPPSFGDKYSVGLTDIGSGYAAGITSAGQSIAGAISGVMGGFNQRTGEIQEGVLGQKKSSEDTLDMLHQHGMMTDDEYSKAKTSSLGAQQKMIGQYTSEFNTKLQSQLEQQKALAVNAQSETGATYRTGLTETGAAQRQAAQIAAQQEQARQAAAKARAVAVPATTTTTNQPAPLPKLNLNLVPTPQGGFNLNTGTY